MLLKGMGRERLARFDVSNVGLSFLCGFAFGTKHRNDVDIRLTNGDSQVIEVYFPPQAKCLESSRQSNSVIECDVGVGTDKIVFSVRYGKRN